MKSEYIPEPSTTRKIKIGLFGASKVGKRTIINQMLKLKKNPTSKEQIPIEDNDSQIQTFQRKFKYHHQSYEIQVWNTRGYDKNPAVVQQYYNGLDGYIIVFDITFFESFEIAKQIVNGIKKKKSNFAQTCIILGNKNDCEKDRKVDFQEMAEFAMTYNIVSLETSIHELDSIKCAFTTLIQKVLINKYDENKMEDPVFEDEKCMLF